MSFTRLLLVVGLCFALGCGDDDNNATDSGTGDSSTPTDAASGDGSTPDGSVSPDGSAGDSSVGDSSTEDGSTNQPDAGGDAGFECPNPTPTPSASATKEQACEAYCDGPAMHCDWPDHAPDCVAGCIADPNSDGWDANRLGRARDCYIAVESAADCSEAIVCITEVTDCP